MPSPCAFHRLPAAVRRALAGGVAAAMVACTPSSDSRDHGIYPTGPVPPAPTTPAPPVPDRVTRVQIVGDLRGLYPGFSRAVWMMAFAANGADALTTNVTWRSSDTSIVQVPFANGGGVLQARGSGTATIEVVADGVRASVAVTVGVLPPPSTAVVVDSFVVASGMDTNGETAYVPRLWLHLAAGSAPAVVVATAFQLYQMDNTPYCTSARAISAGPSVALFAPADSLVFEYYNGYRPPEAGPSKAVLIVRDAAGQLGTVMALGTSALMGELPIAPATGPSPWDCIGR